MSYTPIPATKVIGRTSTLDHTQTYDGGYYNTKMGCLPATAAGQGSDCVRTPKYNLKTSKVISFEDSDSESEEIVKSRKVKSNALNGEISSHPTEVQNAILVHALGVNTLAGGINATTAATVWNVPSDVLLQEAHLNANNGAIATAYTENMYGTGTEDNNYHNTVGRHGLTYSSQYYQNQFLIELAAATTTYDKAFSQFVLKANGNTNRVLRIIRGGRYSFTFHADGLAVSPTTGFPLPKSSGGTVLTKDDTPIPLTFCALILTTDPSVRNYGAGIGTRLPMDGTHECPLWQTINLYADNNIPTVFYIVPVIISQTIANLTTPVIQDTSFDTTTLSYRLACISLKVIVEPKNSTIVQS